MIYKIKLLHDSSICMTSTSCARILMKMNGGINYFVVEISN